MLLTREAAKRHCQFGCRSRTPAIMGNGLNDLRAFFPLELPRTPDSKPGYHQISPR
jgi:hypothetical protein